MNGLVAFAFGAGMLSTVNPCGFALLPAFLAYHLGSDNSPTPALGTPSSAVGRKVINGLATGAMVSVGFAAVFTVTGLLVALGLRSIIGAVPWVAVIIGIVLVGLGVAIAAGRHLGVTVSSRRTGAHPRRGPAGMLAFGAAYAIASLSCTLAVLLAVIAQALAASSLTTLVAVFAAYAAGASTVLILLALSTALASSALATGLRRVSRYLPRIAGVVLVASGLYLIAYWAPALNSGRANQTLASGASPLTSALSNFLQQHTTQITAAAIIAVLTTLVAALWMRRRPALKTPIADHPDLTAGPSTHRPAERRNRF
ncbi:cytochrome c biogenesis protein CcdA [Dermatophilaceae bacterium Soc4.6]